MLIPNLLVELNIIWAHLTQDVPGFLGHRVKKHIHSRQTAISNWMALS